MKKELDYFTIDGAFGGSQEWFTNVVMHIGGCAAATACDSCIYFALRRGLAPLYPFHAKELTRESYKAFSQIMKPYIKPRAGGVSKLEWYMDGLTRYIEDVNARHHFNIALHMEGLAGRVPYGEAKAAVMGAISQGYPVPYLMLRHKDSKFKDFVWHWFLVVGYEDIGKDLIITAATYGSAATMSLGELWDTGYEEKGGLILYRLEEK